MSKKITMRDIARKVGVSHPVVSAVINENYKSVKVSQLTRSKVLEAIKEMSYFPNAAARSLSNRKTGTIGFLLSDVVADGLGNAFFAMFLRGIEQCSRERGYSLTISLYNLSNVDTFVFPAKVGQRSVDGLIMGGFLEKAVVSHFREFAIPCICLGKDLEFPNMVATVSANIVQPIYEVMHYLHGMGHRKIWICDEPHRGALTIHHQLLDCYGDDVQTVCDIITVPAKTGFCDYASGLYLFQQWQALKPAERPTAIFSSDQTILAFLRELHRAGMSCPKDVSLVATCDSSMCTYAYPEVTAIIHPAYDMGVCATNILIDSIEQDIELTPEQTVKDFIGHVEYRRSCGPTGGK